MLCGVAGVSGPLRPLSKWATNLFLRGMVPLVGYRSTKVYYARKERFAGESKYPLGKMLHFALDGIVVFSIHKKILCNRKLN